MARSVRRQRGASSRWRQYAPGVLVVVTGLPGVGKSALATGLARRLRAFVVSVDAIENAVLRAGVPGGWETGVAAYEVAGALAAENLAAGGRVIVDAVSDSEDSRDTWRQAAARAGSTISVIELYLPNVDEHRRRLQERTRPFPHLPEPSWSDVRDRSQRYEPWSEDRLVLDANAQVEALIETAYQYVVGGP